MRRKELVDAIQTAAQKGPQEVTPGRDAGTVRRRG
jgi:cytidylate kinase